nr:hypothetical protein [Segatella copri]
MYLFDESRSAHVSFEGNANVSYNCDIMSHNARLIHRENGNYFMAIATVSTQGQKSPVLQKYMKADVRIIVSNKT